MSQNIKKNSSFFWIAIVIFSAFIFLTIRYVLQYAEERSPFIFEFYAATLGALITASAMTILMKLQSQHEQHKEFASRLFDKKIELYSRLIDTIFEMDDDKIITRQEINNVENRIGGCSLVASEELVGLLSQFMYQLKVYGVVYRRNMTEEQRTHFRGFIELEKQKQDPARSFLAVQKWQLIYPIKGNEDKYFVSLDELIQGIRHDLAVVEGNIEHNLELFTCTEFDKHNLMSRPNIVG